MRRLAAVSAVVGIGIGLAACQSTGGTTQAASSAQPSNSPTTSAARVPGEPVGDTLRGLLAGSSASGPASCSYFGADGSLVRRAGGQVANGTWAIDGRFVCESIAGGNPACYTLDFLPLGGATMTPATGSNVPAQSVQVTTGNACG